MKVRGLDFTGLRGFRDGIRAVQDAVEIWISFEAPVCMVTKPI